MYVFLPDSETRVMPDDASRKTDYACPFCGGAMRLRGGRNVKLHFYHIDKTCCEWVLQSDVRYEHHPFRVLFGIPGSSARLLDALLSQKFAAEKAGFFWEIARALGLKPRNAMKPLVDVGLLEVEERDNYYHYHAVDKYYSLSSFLRHTFGGGTIKAFEVAFAAYKEEVATAKQIASLGLDVAAMERLFGTANIGRYLALSEALQSEIVENSRLYVFSFKSRKRKIYKVGITTNIAKRRKALTADVKNIFDTPSRLTLEVDLPQKGYLESFLKWRWRQENCRRKIYVGQHTEYFFLDAKDPVLLELKSIEKSIK